MNNEILWLIRLGLDQKLFTREQALATLKAVGREAQLMDFAQRLIDDAVVSDVDKLEAIAGNAMARAPLGPPEGNPLLDEAPPAAAPVARAAQPAAGAAFTLVVGDLPQFPFEQIMAMDDKSLADAMRQLLIDAGKSGASDLHLSANSKPFVRRLRALLPLTDRVGAGKTTTLAAMVAELNEQREDHIITVEDPIEVVQLPKGCNVSQREVGPHTKSFFTALKGALREDPDVIVIGELRDLETIEMAISASETGHLVIGTMHTSDASTTLNRLLDVFPPAQQTQIRASVAESLRGVVCQRLLPSTDGGLVVACEIMVSNLAIQALIRDGKTSGLRNTMETGVKEGMCIMENVVLELYQQRKITKETALINVTTKNVRAKIT